MPIRYDELTIYCEAECMVEEALPLLDFLNSHRSATIDMTDCVYVHTAILQVLAAAAKDLMLPASPAMASWVSAVLAAALRKNRRALAAGFCVMELEAPVWPRQS